MQKGLLPSTSALLDACISSLKARGGRATNSEILSDVALELNISEEALSLIHSGNRTELEYRLAWARTSAKKKGLISSPKKGLWEIIQ